jgi:hypothetical protein
LKLFVEVYAQDIEDQKIVIPAKFSKEWCRSFMQRHYISRRRVTHVAQKLPEDWRDTVNRFTMFNRRAISGRLGVEVVGAAGVEEVSKEVERAIPASNICNIDEVPLGFEEKAGYTYSSKGARTVSSVIAKSGWNKRQMTILLAIFADGIERIKPLIIYHGSDDQDRGRIQKTEGELYDSGVVVKFNQTAWNNEQLLVEWLNEQWKPIIDRKYC